MADETDAEKIARLEAECEELTEELHMARKAVEEFSAKVCGIFGFKVMSRG